MLLTVALAGWSTMISLRATWPMRIVSVESIVTSRLTNLDVHISPSITTIPATSDTWSRMEVHGMVGKYPPWEESNSPPSNLTVQKGHTSHSTPLPELMTSTSLGWTTQPTPGEQGILDCTIPIQSMTHQNGVDTMSSISMIMTVPISPSMTVSRLRFFTIRIITILP